MKKTLVALAVLAVSGASFAQANLTGSVAHGYKHKVTAAGVTTNGFGSDGASLGVAASEDLGGGLTAEADFSFENMNYGGGTVSGNGSNLYLMGSFGTLQLNSQKESCNGVVGQAAGVNLDEAGFACSPSNADNIIYQAPAFGPVTVKVLFGDGTEGAEAAQGMGTGNLGASILYVNYAQGPIAAGINFTSFSGPNDAKNGRTRVTASYDLGVAKLSGGYSTGGVAAGAKNDQTVLGVSVPMGALSLGVGYGKTETATASATGTGVVASYALSKRTAVTFKASNFSGAARVDNNNYSAVVGHSF